MELDQVASTNAAAQQPQDGAIEQTPPTPQHDPENDWNERFAKLTLRERQIMNERKAMQEKIKRLERLEALKDDPDSLLKEFGHSYDSLTERRLEKPKSVEQQMIEELKAEIAELKGWKTETVSERQKADEQRLMQQLQSQVESIISGDDAFEFIRTMGEHQLVIDTAAQYYQATGKKVGLDEAARWVERHLEEKYDGLTKTKKWSTKYKNEQVPPSPSQGQAAVDRAVSLSEGQRQGTPSLSNAMAATPTPVGQAGPESEQVLRARAIRLLEDGWKR